MPGLSFRTLHPDDLDGVAAIENKTTGSSRRGFIERYLSAIESSPDKFITCAAVRDGKIVGYGFVRIKGGDFGEEDGVAVLDALGVDPEAQGRGIGKEIIFQIEGEMMKRKLSTLRTQTVWTEQRMTRFFSSIGFELASSQIIERNTLPLREDVSEAPCMKIDTMWPVHKKGENGELFGNAVTIRSLKAEDLAAVIRLDSKLTGRDRADYLTDKFQEMLVESGIRVSLVAEEEQIVAGYVMARVDFGEFGKIDKAAVLDTIGVHPAFSGFGIGQALLSQLILNLATLQVESVRTQVMWNNFELQRFLHATGFGPSQRLVLKKKVL